jgi:hypothetical protein
LELSMVLVLPGYGEGGRTKLPDERDLVLVPVALRGRRA